MNNTDNALSFLRDQNYQKLVAHYIDHPIALYTGAGVSWSDSEKFGVGLWDDFLKKILLCDKDVSPETMNDFGKVKSKWKNEPWKIAEWVAEKIGREEFKRHVTALVQRGENFQKKYKLLSGKFLENARTLNATVAFCAEFSGGKITRGENGRWSAVYRRAINRRVRALVTSNYDPFLEAASSTMFIKPILKPVAARGSSVGGLLEIPVFHIHGYVPFPSKSGKRKVKKLVPFVDPVITKRDYELAWKADNVYNFTMGPQIHILRHYTVLFIGFSFRDEWVMNLLRELNDERGQRKGRLYHYAIMKKGGMDKRGLKRLENELGVRPILIGEFSQIKDLLGHLYQQALIHDHHGSAKIDLPFYEGRRKNKRDRTACLTPEEYFEELYNCRNCGVRKTSLFVSSS